MNNLDEKIEQSMLICEDLKNYKIRSKPLEPVSEELLNEINQIIEEENVSDGLGTDLIQTEPLPSEKPSMELFPKEDISQKDDLPVIENLVEFPTEQITQKIPFIVTFFKKAGSLIICMLLAILFSFLITQYVAHHTKVEGSSMEPNLHNSDHIIVEEISYYFNEPKRFDVIVFPFTKDIHYIKRIIGMPNESIQIIDGNILIDGDELIERFGNERMKDSGLAANVIKLGDDEYFLLGDNRNASTDSRKAEVGVIKRKDIIGRAWLRFYPFDDFGFVL